MFRNPRENAALRTSDAVLPSTGRAPTPPQETGTNRSPYFGRTQPTTAIKTTTAVMQTPILGRQPGPKLSSGKKPSLRQNQSILSFFGKTDRAEVQQVTEAGLFFEDIGIPQASPDKPSIDQPRASTPIQDHGGDRYNEEETPVKRRRLETSRDDDFLRTPSPERALSVTPAARKVSQPIPVSTNTKLRKQRGGFIDDSDDEEDTGGHQVTTTDTTGDTGEQIIVDVEDQILDEPSIEDDEGALMQEVVQTMRVPLKPSDDSGEVMNREYSPQKGDPVRPTLSRQGTSGFVPADFGEDDEFDDEEFFEDGEEYLERRWMQEQAEMEAAIEDDSRSETTMDSPRTPGSAGSVSNERSAASENVVSCPICCGNMKGLSEAEASSHVNACLDGTAKPLPRQEATTPPAPKLEHSIPQQFSGNAKRFQRAAVARPAQANPFLIAEKKPGASAFGKLMSGHAEDAAWAEAAANEMKSRGKPAYQRTCPFYKIMPGFYICVDAFRYGKVEGQNAYFLSHFHSDHYIGLTSSWCHGPIYASKVSCNLMRQQLKVDAKWLHPLEFEKKVEVPNTNGVFVTMIPANHCPGSSLFLFEKMLGKSKDGSLKMTRVLHCGDFRACPAHVKHPLLMPDVMDAVTGQTRHQIIDTCYLDTTYLTPKFSFPSQHDVIDACAQMCVSLSKEVVDSNDNWEKTKLSRAGSAMTKFLEQGEKEAIEKGELVKKEEEDEDQKPRRRGRLLVVIGTYSIGKERICLGIANALGSKIYAPPAKMRICKALEDPELDALLTSDPLDAQVHMQTLMEIRAETLHDYLITYKGHFSRVVGFRPTGWTYRPPANRFTANPTVHNVLFSEGWKSPFTMRDLTPQRGSTRESNCFGVPYSEHSSFRELTMFCCALRIVRIVPTVNVGNARSRERMKGWVEKWDLEKKKNGLFQVEVGAEGWGSGDGKLRYGV